MEITKPYQKIKEACKTTGLSQYMLRHGCQDGTVPHIRSGRTYYVDVPALLDKLATQMNEMGENRREAIGTH